MNVGNLQQRLTIVIACNRVDNTHLDTLVRPFHLRPVTYGFGCRELVAIG